MADYETHVETEEDELTVRVTERVKNRTLDGGMTESDAVRATVSLPASPDLAEKIGNALLEWYAEKQEASAGPPDDVPRQEY